MAWVTIGEAQALLGLSGRTTLNNLAKNGTIPTRMGLLRGRKVQLFQTDGLAELWAANVQPRMKRTAEPSPAPLDSPPAPLDPAPAPLDPAPAPLDPAPASLDPAPASLDPAPVSVAVAPAPKAEKRRSAAVANEPPAGSAAADFDEKSAAADFDENGVPVYNVQRAWAEYEKRLHEKEKRQITALERMEKEGILVYREDIEAAQAAVNAQIMSRAEALPKQIKLDIPHLTLEEMAAIEKRVMQIFEAVSEHDYAEVPE